MSTDSCTNTVMPNLLKETQKKRKEGRSAGQLEAYGEGPLLMMWGKD